MLKTLLTGMIQWLRLEVGRPAMMGPVQNDEPKLFYTGFCLADRIPAEHILRRIRQLIDFSFVRDAVAHFYGHNGNESIDPIVLMKLMLLLFLEKVPSERELMRRLSYRLDWLWFCGYDVDAKVPDHSVLSKARGLWGVEVFEQLFAVVLEQCIAHGLVGGEAIHVDGSCIDGNVDKDKLRPVLEVVGRELYEQLDAEAQRDAEAQLDAEARQDAEAQVDADAQREAEAPREQKAQRPSGRLTAESDPEAGVTQKGGQTICGYKDHRSVDDAEGIITATRTTDAAADEGHLLGEVLDAHERNTGAAPAVVAADKQYGTGENYRALRERGIRPCIPHRKQPAPRGRFGRDRFTYDAARDCLICPAGQCLYAYHRDEKGRRVRYRAGERVCRECPLRSQCTNSKCGRRVERHMDQEHIDWADECLSRGQRRRWMRRRQIRVEGSFADAAACHGFKRARWRGLLRMRIQNLLIAAVQNLRKLLKKTFGGRRPAAVLSETPVFAPSAAVVGVDLRFCRPQAALVGRI